MVGPKLTATGKDRRKLCGRPEQLHDRAGRLIALNEQGVHELDPVNVRDLLVPILPNLY